MTDRPQSFRKVVYDDMTDRPQSFSMVASGV